jgi:ribonuclease BN (tRNA processing enzyme)
MKITLLGTGCAVPDFHRGSPSTLLRNEGVNFLLDAGPGTYRRLLEIGVSPVELRILLFSHHHPDHIADLPGILAGIKNALRVMDRQVETPLTILGGPGFSEHIERLRDAYSASIDITEYRPLEVREGTPGQDVHLDGLTISSAPVVHTRTSVAFRFVDRAGRALVYTGDTGFSDGLASFCRDADLVIAECSFPDERKQETHMTPSAIRRLAEEARPGRIVLVHFYPGWTLDPRTFEGLETEVIEGRDLMEVEA